MRLTAQLQTTKSEDRLLIAIPDLGDVLKARLPLRPSHPRATRGPLAAHGVTPQSRAHRPSIADPYVVLVVETQVRLLKQLDLVGAAELETAIAEVIKRGTPHLAAVHHVLERRRYQRGTPPAVGRHLPVDDRVQGPIVTPHPLSEYDEIARNEDNDD